MMARPFRLAKTRVGPCSKWISLLLVATCSLLVLLVAAATATRPHQRDQIDEREDYEDEHVDYSFLEDQEEKEAEDEPSFRSAQEGRRIRRLMWPQLDYSTDSKRVDPMVYDQAGCQSGWAYALTGQLEGQEQPAGLLKGGRLEPKSKQQLLNCHPSGPSLNLRVVVDYLNDNAIAALKRDVPRLPRGQNGSHRCMGRCEEREECDTYTLENISLAKSNSGFINGDQAPILERVLRDYGPVAWTTDQWSPQWNSRHVVHLPCLNGTSDNTNSSLSHTILLVGFGKSYGVQYFKFKNSLGPDWGERGYGYIWANGGRDCPYRMFGSFHLLRVKPCRCS